MDAETPVAETPEAESPDAETPRGGPRSRRRARTGPPGPLLYATALAAGLLLLDASSRQSLATYMFAAIWWLGIALIWLLRLALAVQRTGWRQARSHWLRWVAIPALLLVVLVIARTDALVDARFGLSRGAMDAMAADVMAGGTTDRGWVGLYNVGSVDVTGNGVRFVVDDSGPYRWGFAFSTQGQPTFIADAEETAGLWSSASFVPLDDGWWQWSETWG